jgi:hypothetical protein
MFKNKKYIIIFLLALLVIPLAIYFSQKRKFIETAVSNKKYEELFDGKHEYIEINDKDTYGERNIRDKDGKIRVPIFYSPSHFGTNPKTELYKKSGLYTITSIGCMKNEDYGKMSCGKQRGNKCCDSCSMNKNNTRLCTKSDYWWWEKYLDIILTPAQASKLGYSYNTYLTDYLNSKMPKFNPKIDIVSTETTQV